VVKGDLSIPFVQQEFKTPENENGSVKAFSSSWPAGLPFPEDAQGCQRDQYVSDYWR
jgi:hypothetical protein